LGSLFVRVEGWMVDEAFGPGDFAFRGARLGQDKNDFVRKTSLLVSTSKPNVTKNWIDFFTFVFQ